MAILFDFGSLITCILLFICSCTYMKMRAPKLLDRHKTGFSGVFWKAARIGERKSEYVSIFLVIMALFQLFSPTH